MDFEKDFKRRQEEAEIMAKHSEARRALCWDQIEVMIKYNQIPEVVIEKIKQLSQELKEKDKKERDFFKSAWADR